MQELVISILLTVVIIMASFLLASLSTKNDKSFTKRIHKCIIYYRKEEKYE